MIDLYLYFKFKASKSVTVERDGTSVKIPKIEYLKHLVGQSKFRLFVTDDPECFKGVDWLRDRCSCLTYDDGRDSFYIERLIAPHTVADIRGGGHHRCTSSAGRLLQYALFFGAREVYLIGMDFGRGDYFFGHANFNITKHALIDENFVKIIAERYDNVFSLSPRSPVKEYLPCRMF